MSTCKKQSLAYQESQELHASKCITCAQTVLHIYASVRIVCIVTDVVLAQPWPNFEDCTLGLIKNALRCQNATSKPVAGWKILEDSLVGTEVADSHLCGLSQHCSLFYAKTIAGCQCQRSTVSSDQFSSNSIGPDMHRHARQAPATN